MKSEVGSGSLRRINFSPKLREYWLFSSHGIAITVGQIILMKNNCAVIAPCMPNLWSKKDWVINMFYSMYIYI